MSKLEERGDLDPSQKAKLERKPDIEMELGTAKGLAKVRVRHELKCQLLATVA